MDNDDRAPAAGVVPIISRRLSQIGSILDSGGGGGEGAHRCASLTLGWYWFFTLLVMFLIHRDVV